MNFILNFGCSKHSNVLTSLLYLGFIVLIKKQSPGHRDYFKSSHHLFIVRNKVLTMKTLAMDSYHSYDRYISRRACMFLKHALKKFQLHLKDLAKKTVYQNTELIYLFCIFQCIYWFGRRGNCSGPRSSEVSLVCYYQLCLWAYGKGKKQV